MERAPSEVTLCGAPLRKKPGQFCGKPVAPGGNGRCVLHGKNSRRGPDHPRWKGGAYSAYLPRDLRKRYEDWLNDAELLAARHEVALLKARLTELSERLTTGESGPAIERATTALRRARDSGDEAAIRAAVDAAIAEFGTARGRDEAWEAFTMLAERSTLIAQREAKRVLEARLYASADEVRVLIASITAAVLLHVPDANARLAIAEHVRRLQVLPEDDAAFDAVPTDHGNEP